MINVSWSIIPAATSPTQGERGRDRETERGSGRQRERQRETERQRDRLSSCSLMPRQLLQQRFASARVLERHPATPQSDTGAVPLIAFVWHCLQCSHDRPGLELPYLGAVDGSDRGGFQHFVATEVPVCVCGVCDNERDRQRDRRGQRDRRRQRDRETQRQRGRETDGSPDLASGLAAVLHSQETRTVLSLLLEGIELSPSLTWQPLSSAGMKRSRSRV